jgi:site-specific recombinase XerD
MMPEYNNKTGDSGDGPSSTDTLDLIESFDHWMRYHRGAAESTIRLNAFHVSKFVASLGDNPAAYDAGGVRSFILARASQHRPKYAGAVASAVRMYLRFLLVKGFCTSDLVAAVPSIANWRLSSIPRYLPAEKVERIVSSCDPATMAGVRDQAALLLLARLGLRAGDVAGLRLEDIDWSRGKLRVMGKGRRETWLPLPQEVGDAVLRYMEHFRPDVQDDHVLLRLTPPYKGLRSQAVSTLVRSAIKRAGIDTPSFGAHMLRHSAATEMLRQGTPLEYIGAILRHRSIDSTAHYAKVDLPLLRSVVQPWPTKEVPSC